MNARLSTLLGLGFALVPLAWFPGADSYVWPKWLVVYLCASVLALQSVFTRQNFTLPATRLLPLAFGVLLAYLAVLLTHLPGAYEGHALDALVFTALVLASSHAFAREDGAWSRIARFALWGGVLAALGSMAQALSDPGSLPGSTLGHPNFAGEAYGFLSLIAASEALQAKEARKRFGFAILSSLFLSLLFLLKSRAAFLSTGIGFAILFLFSPLPRAKKAWILGLGLLGASILVATIAAPKLLYSGNEQLEAQKEGNLWLRKVRWRNTLSLIKDHPLGIGPGNYEFGYLPYANSWTLDGEAHDGIVIRSPHNGYIESLAENGILFTLLMLGALAALLVRVARNTFETGKKHRATCLAGFSFFLCDALVAFPMETPFPFFAVAVLLGLALHIASNGETRALRLGLAPKTAFVALLLLGTALFSFSKAVEADFLQSRSAVSAACNLFPSNWRVCLKYAKSELEEKRYAEGKAALERMLRFQPHNYQALRLLSFAHFRMGAKEEACATLKHYNSLFFGGSSLIQQTAKLCGER